MQGNLLKFLLEKQIILTRCRQNIYIYIQKKYNDCHFDEIYIIVETTHTHEKNENREILKNSIHIYLVLE